MSVDVTRIIGYTVTLKEDLSHQDFEFFNSIEDKYKEFEYGGRYSQWGHRVKSGNTCLIVDGMCSQYARLVYIVKASDSGFPDEDEYLLLKDNGISEEIYNDLNNAYQMIYNEPLDRNKIEYAMWYYIS